MSFKDKLLDYCENKAKHDCPYCAFREPCDMISAIRMPNHWKDPEFDEMRVHVSNYIDKTRKDLRVMSALLRSTSE